MCEYRHRWVVSATWVAAIAASLTACGNGRTSADGAVDVLVMLDSTRLEENDTLFIGQPMGFAVTRNGGYLIADQRVGTIHEYDARGKYVRRIGRRGNGPNEFSGGPGRLEVEGDSLVVVFDGRMLKVFDFRSGTFRWERPLPAFTAPLAVRHGVVYLDRVDYDRRTSIMTLRSASDTPTAGGPFPPTLDEHPAIGKYFSAMQIAPRGGGDTVAIAIQSSDNLYVGSIADGTFDSIPVPIVQRRGARTDLMSAATDNPASMQPLLYQQSVPWALGWLSPRSLGVVYTDVEWVANSRFAGKLFLSVIGWEPDRACTDIPIPAPVDPQPRVEFRADTLLVLIQDVVPDSATGGTAVSFVRRYVINEAACDQ